MFDKWRVGGVTSMSCMHVCIERDRERYACVYIYIYIYIYVCVCVCMFNLYKFFFRPVCVGTYRLKSKFVISLCMIYLVIWQLYMLHWILTFYIHWYTELHSPMWLLNICLLGAMPVTFTERDVYYWSANLDGKRAKVECKVRGDISTYFYQFCTLVDCFEVWNTFVTVFIAN